MARTATRDDSRLREAMAKPRPGCRGGPTATNLRAYLVELSSGGEVWVAAASASEAVGIAETAFTERGLRRDILTVTPTSDGAGALLADRSSAEERHP